MRWITGIPVVAAVLALAACDSLPWGGKNLALEDNGGRATANFDQASAHFVNDGETGTESYWAGGTPYDHVTVELEQKAKLKKLRVHTNRANDADLALQFSEDGESFTTIAYDEHCKSSSLGEGRIQCRLDEPVKAGFVRVELLNNVDGIEIYEIEAKGSTVKQ